MSLSKIQQILYKPETTIETIVKAHKEWVANDQYLIFEHTRFHEKTRYIASLLPKRGNEKYAYNIKRKFDEFRLPFDYEAKISPNENETTTNVLFITLTYDTKLSEFKQSWNREEQKIVKGQLKNVKSGISQEWNRFVANLRKIYGRVLTARCFESSEEGYAHIHAIVYIQDHAFNTFLKYSRKKHGYQWRINFEELEKIESTGIALLTFKEWLTYLTDSSISANI